MYKYGINWGCRGWEDCLDKQEKKENFPPIISYSEETIEKKLEKMGPLFQNRFIRELITEDTYLLEVSKYIHNNPVKANIMEEPETYSLVETAKANGLNPYKYLQLVLTVLPTMPFQKYMELLDTLQP